MSLSLHLLRPNSLSEHRDLADSAHSGIVLNCPLTSETGYWKGLVVMSPFEPKQPLPTASISRHAGFKRPIVRRMGTTVLVALVIVSHTSRAQPSGVTRVDVALPLT